MTIESKPADEELSSTEPVEPAKPAKRRYFVVGTPGLVVGGGWIVGADPERAPREVESEET